MKTRRCGILLALAIGVATGAEPAAPAVALRVNGRAAGEEPLPVWRGTVASEPLLFEIVESPATLTHEQLGRRQLLRLRDALLAPDMPRAETILRQLWDADRARPEGWLAMALLSEARGEVIVALAQINTAIARALGLVNECDQGTSYTSTIAVPPAVLLAGATWAV